MIDEGAHLHIFDPQVDKKQIIFELSNLKLNLSQEIIKKQVTIANDLIEACNQSHALVICTEWDEFKVYSNIRFKNYYFLICSQF